MHIRLQTTLLAAAMAGSALAQAPVLVDDVNDDGLGFDSQCDGDITGYNIEAEEDSFVQANGFWYFTATTGAAGNELWRTDGTAAGTSMVMDINPGAGSSSPSRLTSYYGIGVFFTANDGTNGTELWYTNGVTTTMLVDINPGSASSSPNHLYVHGPVLYFSANDGVNGNELWTSDTSPVGTNMLLDIRVGGSGNPGYFAPVPGGSDLVFKANNGASGNELWITDGTAAGTTLLFDTRSGSSSGISSSSRIVPFGPFLIFEANDGVVGEELWMTDGTPGGTGLLLDINGTSGSSSIDLEFATVFNGYLYFRANGGTGTELWRTDGTAAGTTMHWDCNTSTATSSGFPGKFRLHNGELYFRASVNNGSINYGAYELCKLDAAGTPSVVADFNTGTGGGLGFSADLFSFNGELFFTGNSGGSGTELCKTDGTAAGTVLVADIEPGTTGSNPNWFTPINATQMIFTADTMLQGEELWITDGTAAGTTLLFEADATVNSPDSDPASMISLNGKDLFFTAKIPGGTGNEELCKWEPGVGVSIIKDIRPGSSGSAIDDGDWTYARLLGQDMLVFGANDGTTGNELWISDGTTAGTTQIIDLFPGTSNGSAGDQLVYFNGLVYFEGADGNGTGNELWATNGTPGGTILIKDINPGTAASGILMFNNNIIFNNELYFRADDGVNGTELWKTDGTPAGTVMVADINPSGGSNPNYPVIFNGMLLFQANDGVNGAELWMTDGTAAGTVMLADLKQVTGQGSNVMNFGGTAEMDGWLYFRADAHDGTIDYGFELHRTNLITTELVADVRTGSGDGSPGNIVRIGDRILFRANDGSTGNELWSTDGTAAGTQQVIDLNPGTAQGYTATDIRVDVLAVGEGLYFEGDDGVNGDELWFTDGTAAGTYMVGDINANGDSNATHFAVANGQLFFSATDGFIGDELWTVVSPGATVQSLGHSGDGSRLRASTPVIGENWSYSFDGSTIFGGTMPDGSTSIGSVRVWGSALDNSFASPGITDLNSSIWFDLSLAPVVVEFSPAPNGAGGFLIPNDPGLMGLRANVQSVTLRDTILPFATSNAVSLYLGN